MSLVNTMFRGNIFKHGSIVLFDQGFLSIANFVTGVLVARSCTKSDYGIYVLTWSILLIFASIQRALVQAPFTVYLPKLSENEKDTYQGSTLLHILALSVILFIIIALLSISASNSIIYQSGSIREYGLVIAILTTPLLMREYIRSVLFARLDFTSSLIANSTGTTLQLAAIGYLYINEKLNPTSAFIIILFGSLYAASLMFWSHRKQFIIIPSLTYKHFLQSWKTGKWMILNVLGMTGSTQMYPWLILTFIDTKSVAIYGAALAVSNVMAPFLRAVNAYVLPKMAHGYKDQNTETLNRMLMLSILAILLPYSIWTITGSVFADKIMIMLYSKTYSGYSAVVILLLIKSMIESASSPLTSALQTLERPDLTTIALLLGVIITFTLGVYLTYEYGLVGCATATLITTSVIAVFKYICIKRVVRESSTSGLKV